MIKIAISRAHKSIVKYLLENKEIVNEKDENGVTVLMRGIKINIIGALSK